MADAYESAIQDAHNASHGSPEMIAHLKRANEFLHRMVGIELECADFRWRVTASSK